MGRVSLSGQGLAALDRTHLLDPRRGWICARQVWAFRDGRAGVRRRGYWEGQSQAMTRVFGHEKLVVYRKAMAFLVLRVALLDKLTRRVAASEHLERAAESILHNIASASSAWSPRARLVGLGHANGSALECAACLDVLVAKGLLSAVEVRAGKTLLAEVVSMLIAMRKTTEGRVQEDRAAYRSQEGWLFSHEELDVYRAALQFVTWLERASGRFSCSADLRSKLDCSSTAIVLNIAEGTGRFSGVDQARFFLVAYRAAAQSAALVDVAAAGGLCGSVRVGEGRDILGRIAAMLASLARAATHGSGSRQSDDGDRTGRPVGGATAGAGE